MKFTQFLIVLFLTSHLLSGQSYWEKIDFSDIPSHISIVNTVIPAKQQTLRLDYVNFKKYLKSAPLEFSNKRGVSVDIPMPDGSMERFECYSSPVLEDPAQQDQYKVYTYKARSISHPEWSLRMDYSPWGFHASINTSNGQVFIEPVTDKAGAYYTSYFVNDLAKEKPELFKYICEVDESLIDLNEKPKNNIRFRGEEWPLLTYRVAISCTGEWGGNSALGGGTVELAMAKITSAVNIINEVFEREVGIRLLIVSNNQRIIFLNPKTDPFANANQGRQLIGQNTAIINRNIGERTYDIGHVFTASCSDVGGIASLGSVCSPGKGNGVTCWYTSNINYVAVQITCHEMGHQFSAPHTFNNCNGNESGATAFEPGGGSTIMSYSGLCGAQSFVPRADPVYHNNSLTRFFNHTRVSENGNCGKKLDVVNTRPNVNIPIEDGFTIPYLTPFELTGEGSDDEDDVLTYSWEQYTTGRQISIGEPVKGAGNVPLFRSFPPSKSPTRIFPRLSLILHNSNNIPVSDLTEVLPPYEFKFKFAFTVRDNNPDAGAASWDYLKFNATEKAGPFKVLWPNTAMTLDASTYQFIEWDVANTDLPPVNCKNVDIYLFKERDYEHPILLVENTPNDGSEWVLLPEVNMRSARIKVKASNSIFFDVSDKSIKINTSDQPKTSLAIFPNTIKACLPQQIKLNIKSTGDLKSDTIRFIGLDGIPEHGSYEIKPTELIAGGDGVVSLDLMDVSTDGEVELQLKYTINNKDTFLLKAIPLKLIRNYYEELDLVRPVSEHKYSAGPNYMWKSDPDALSYNIQVATNPAFDSSSLVFESEGLTKTSIRGPLLDVNTIYYWRVRGKNSCGFGPWTKTTVFSTIASTCSTFSSSEKNQTITGGHSKTFTLPVDKSIRISDLNIKNITLDCEFLNGINMKLIAPENSASVTIWKNSCFNQSFMNASFDDDAPDVARCATIGEGITSRLRRDNLSNMKGVQGKGDWKLVVANKGGNRSALLEKWELELCGDISFEPPLLVHNDTLKIRPNTNAKILKEKLLVQDDKSGTRQLNFTLLTIPDFGMLMLNDKPLNVGNTFTQQDIYEHKLRYMNTDNTTDDSFDFIVADAEGGWTGIHTFNISIDPNNPAIATKNPTLETIGYQVFPNPVKHALWIIPIRKTQSNSIELTLTNLSGKTVLHKHNLYCGSKRKIDVSHILPGIYMMTITTTSGSSTKKLIIQ